MKRRVPGIFLICCVILVIASVVTVKTIRKNHIETLITDKTTISIYQKWTLKFKQELTEDEVANIKIKVKDSEGKEVKNYISTGYGMKTIEVQAPDGGYTEGMTYTIEVNSKIPFTWYESNLAISTLKFTPKKAYENKKAKFQDKNFELLIREMIERPKGDIYVEDIEGITTLIANGRGIRRIHGIEYLVNLRELYLDVNEIEDIKPLKNLVYLEKLGLSNNKIKNIEPLQGMKLKYLGLSNNNISDYSQVRSIYDELLWKDFDIR